MPYSPKTWNLTDPITDTDLNHIETGIDDVTADFDAFIAADSGWIATGMSAGGGWSLTDYRYRRVNNLVFVYVHGTKTGGTISVPANGNIANADIGTLPVGYRPTYTQGLATGSAGRAAAFSVGSDGKVSITAVAGTGDIEADEEVSASGVFILG
jgi:hypothetical protein